MAIPANGTLRIFFLNVGQGDTTIVITPLGRVIVIDATRPNKTTQFLRDLGGLPGDEIDTLVISHPHTDHYTAAGRLLIDYHVDNAILSPYWNSVGQGPPAYRQLAADIYNRQIRCTFLSGYARFFPDGRIPGNVQIELLGPGNGLIRSLEEQFLFKTNHLSIMSRITWSNRTTIVAADAQMENWATFDSEYLAVGGCNVLRAAHHGSGNGTQWERLDRLRPSAVIVSSDLTYHHRLPDVAGAAVFARFARPRILPGPLVAITGESGTIELVVDAGGQMEFFRYGDWRDDNVDLNNRIPLTTPTNPTDWKAILLNKANAL